MFSHLMASMTVPAIHLSSLYIHAIIYVPCNSMKSLCALVLDKSLYGIVTGGVAKVSCRLRHWGVQLILAFTLGKGCCP